MNTRCFHCAEFIPKGISLFVSINNIEQPMCCLGCQAVAQTIVDNNLTQYYQVRTEPAHKGQALIPEQLEKNKLLDEEVLQNEFIYHAQDYKEAILTIDGISCAACAWLIEMQIAKVSGVVSINVNATTQRATVQWQDDTVNLSDILTAIEHIGYQALPFKANEAEVRNKKHSKTFIKRLGISGILMMQVMMIAVGLYFGAFADMAEHNKVYLRWISFILTIPIITYGAFPFYIGAINALKVKRLSMDVPVSIAIILAFSASAWATVSQQGEVYFESVSMFTFLLLIGKFLEFRARSRAAQVSANLLKLMPMTALKIIIDNEEEVTSSQNQEKLIAAKQLIKDDFVLIKPGEVIPADGIIIKGKSQLNEAMLSGEQLPVNKSVDDKVFAGTINGDSNLIVKVSQASNQSFLSQLIRLSEHSQAHKPKLAKFSDKVAQYFVAIILCTAIGTAIYWQQHLPEEAFWITLSVLVATCPCALSLATPTALTCATTRLNKNGIMIKSAHVMETMPQVDSFAFDKTGTITDGEFSIADVQHENNIKKDDVLAIAAALEAQSEHPLAKPFHQYRNYQLQVSNIEVHSGQGVSGTVNNVHYKIGKPNWLLSDTALLNYQDRTCVLVKNNSLTNETEVLASFSLIDKIRDEAVALINTLNTHANTLLLSGDSQLACDKLMQNVPIKMARGGLTAEHKMQIIKTEQASKHRVAMTGDGVNDSPVFGAAHVSIAMGCGADIAKSGADVILLNNRLSSISTLINVAKKTKKIIFQNYLWAFGYNAIVLPLAVAGFITPYMAVIGMSASSILVITNSLRLLKNN
ncbi:heavy metal translocating P-type ATPase [Colwellia sp. RSH04]|uniref:heavy metal translocating P-type ATPase n=1 Tax=Colwellia sp. RSH04 TaxID=2305464 RepID=UPI000E580222|nr:heavy metal translocating P-type ATPase [Colwellia sp. RSH04]RHW77003.1 cadmium-translocating P-type ATPase [Colwellia sp. RSH04]